MTPPRRIEERVFDMHCALTRYETSLLYYQLEGDTASIESLLGELPPPNSHQQELQFRARDETSERLLAGTANDNEHALSESDQAFIRSVVAGIRWPETPPQAALLQEKLSHACRLLARAEAETGTCYPRDTLFYGLSMTIQALKERREQASERAR